MLWMVHVGCLIQLKEGVGRRHPLCVCTCLCHYRGVCLHYMFLDILQGLCGKGSRDADVVPQANMLAWMLSLLELAALVASACLASSALLCGYMA
jgi:hypothetical protein